MSSLFVIKYLAVKNKNNTYLFIGSRQGEKLQMQLDDSTKKTGSFLSVSSTGALHQRQQQQVVIPGQQSAAECADRGVHPWRGHEREREWAREEAQKVSGRAGGGGVRRLLLPAAEGVKMHPPNERTRHTPSGVGITRRLVITVMIAGGGSAIWPLARLWVADARTPPGQWRASLTWRRHQSSRPRPFRRHRRVALRVPLGRGWGAGELLILTPPLSSLVRIAPRWCCCLRSPCLFVQIARTIEAGGRVPALIASDVLRELYIDCSVCALTMSNSPAAIFDSSDTIFWSL